MDRPIPAFYCAYLLRSLTKVQPSASVYIGSTPDPRRRLRQHNGEIQGGAHSTKADSRRPWEMALLVTGFPSKIAALQFEWSWQNTHLTRHVPTEDKHILKPKMRMNRHGKLVKKPNAPNPTLGRKLADLHTLLRSNSFKRWPLDVFFFSQTVYQHWQTKTLPSTPFRLPPYTRIVFNGDVDVNSGSVANGAAAGARLGGIKAMDVSYQPMLDHVRKGRAVTASASHTPCAVCKSSMDTSRDLLVICPNGDCAMTAHLVCLSADFARQSGSGSSVLPVSGNCPSCDSPLSWVSLARESSLRVRGAQDIEKLLKPAKTKKGDSAQMAVASAATDVQPVDLQEETSDAESQNSLMPRDDLVHENLYSHEDSGPERTDGLNDIDLPEPQEARGSNNKSNKLPVVVPDSDWDDIEELST